MPVFTAAVIAVTAAIEAATVASIATAAVAVSAAIGVAGLGVTAVGAITGNKSLLQAGKVMGFVGLAGGLAGGAIGGLGAMAEGGSFLQGASGAFSGAASKVSDAASSYMDNISSFFNPKTAEGVIGASPLGQESLGTGIVAGTNPSAAVGLDTTGLDQQAMGIGVSRGTTATLSPNVTLQGAADPTVSTAQSLAESAGPQASPAPAAPPPVNAPPSPMAPPAPVQPGVTGMPPGTGGVQDSINAGGLGMRTLGTGAAQATPTTGQGLFDSMPDWMKYSVATTGAQGLTGMAAGYYQGLNAQEQLNFQKLVNSQNQNQVQYLNKNNAYAPLVKFGTQPNPTTGLINRPGA